MYAALTVRSLKSGTYDEWRQAWEADEWPEGSKKAYILRNVDDPDEIIAFGFFEGNLTELGNDKTFVEQQKTRFEQMAPYVESTGADGIYEVLEEVSPKKVTAAVSTIG